MELDSFGTCRGEGGRAGGRWVRYADDDDDDEGKL
jgi:hypothetical protein